MSDQPGRDPAKDMTPVTIPYFLYEAMARAYYLREENADRPVVVRGGGAPDPDSLAEAMHMDEDMPSGWTPGGFALRKKVQDARKTDAAD